MYYFRNKAFPCSASLAMQFIGGRWKTVILHHLQKKKRYSELRKELPLVTERTLSLQLKEMESDGLILRTVTTDTRPLRVEYELTPLGKSLSPVLQAISVWGLQVAKKNTLVKCDAGSRMRSKDKGSL